VLTLLPSFGVSTILQEPTAFRILLMFAGLHYMWNAGALFDYDSTIIFHKVESMRIVKSWLDETTSRTAGMCVRLILTLCVAEVGCLTFLA
jgi:hypothetical protein